MGDDAHGAAPSCWRCLSGKTARRKSLVNRPPKSNQNQRSRPDQGAASVSPWGNQVRAAFQRPFKSLGAGQRLLQPDTVGHRPNGLTWFLTRHGSPPFTRAVCTAFAPDHPVQFGPKHDLRQCEVNIAVIAARIMACAQKNTRAPLQGSPGASEPQKGSKEACAVSPWRWHQSRGRGWRRSQPRPGWRRPGHCLAPSDNRAAGHKGRSGCNR